MPKNRKYPTLYVKNFAKIKEAEIELAPFTVFIGDNNSGKSYLASLIWYIQSSNLLTFDRYRQYKNKYKEYKFLNNLCNNIVNNEKFEIKIDNNIIDECIKLFNAMLKNKKNKILEELFNFKNIKIIKLMVYKADIDYNIKINSNILENERIKTKRFNITFKFGYGRRQIILTESSNIKKRIFFYLFEVIIDIILFRTRHFNKLFLPVARTGFLLLKDTVMDKAFDTLFDNKLEKKETVKLTKPLENFIRELSMLRSEDEKNNNIINFIENYIIRGKIYLDKMPSPQIHYKSNNSDMDFQMHVSSAVITELAPLILFLKYSRYNENIIMEEPEISLHPYLQQQLTRAFIKLVNSGKNVLITTHSDTIVQHINNMIKLNANEKEKQKKLMEKYKYDEDDIISEDKIRMYQFDTKEDGTEVKALESSKYGFEAPTFHNYLIKISDEFDSFIENIDNSDE